LERTSEVAYLAIFYFNFIKTPIFMLTKKKKKKLLVIKLREKIEVELIDEVCIQLKIAMVHFYGL
jgi:hypothetical protein